MAWTTQTYQCHHQTDVTSTIRLDVLAGAILFAAIAFNSALAIINAHILALSQTHVIIAEATIIASAAGLVTASWRSAMVPWAILIGVLSVTYLLSAVAQSGALDAKIYRDILIAPVFILLGVVFARRSISNLLCFLQSIVILFVILEIAAVETYSKLFNISSYYINTRGFQAHHFWMADTTLFPSAVRPDERFLVGLLDNHRLSSFFLEPVSLGNYCVIVTAATVALWQEISCRRKMFLLASTFVLLIGSDGRFATVTCMLLIIGCFVFTHLPRRTHVAFVPLVLITALITGVTFDLSAETDDFGGRVAKSVALFTALSPAAYLGDWSELYRYVDSGFAYLIASQSLLGATVFCFFIGLIPRMKDRSEIIFVNATWSYVSLSLLVSYSFFSIKTGALLWFVYGYMYVRGLQAAALARRAKPALFPVRRPSMRRTKRTAAAEVDGAIESWILPPFDHEPGEEAQARDTPPEFDRFKEALAVLELRNRAFGIDPHWTRPEQEDLQGRQSEIHANPDVVGRRSRVGAYAGVPTRFLTAAAIAMRQRAARLHPSQQKVVPRLPEHGAQSLRVCRDVLHDLAAGSVRRQLRPVAVKLGAAGLLSLNAGRASGLRLSRWLRVIDWHRLASQMVYTAIGLARWQAVLWTYAEQTGRRFRERIHARAVIGLAAARELIGLVAPCTRACLASVLRRARALPKRTHVIAVLRRRADPVGQAASPIATWAAVANRRADLEDALDHPAGTTVILGPVESGREGFVCSALVSAPGYEPEGGEIILGANPAEAQTTFVEFVRKAKKRGFTCFTVETTAERKAASFLAPAKPGRSDMSDELSQLAELPSGTISVLGPLEMEGAEFSCVAVVGAPGHGVEEGRIWLGAAENEARRELVSFASEVRRSGSMCLLAETTIEFDLLIRQLRKAWKPEAQAPATEATAHESQQREMHTFDRGDLEAAARLREVAGRLAGCVAPNRHLLLHNLTVKNHEIVLLVRHGDGLHDTIPVYLGDDPRVAAADRRMLAIELRNLGLTTALEEQLGEMPSETAVDTLSPPPASRVAGAHGSKPHGRVHDFARGVYEHTA